MDEDNRPPWTPSKITAVITAWAFGIYGLGGFIFAWDVGLLFTCGLGACLFLADA